MHSIAKLMMLSLALLVSCEAEWRMGDAVQEHYDYESLAYESQNDVANPTVCELYSTPYVETPSYCEQWPGLECCTWEDDMCETQWCLWDDKCTWDWQYTECTDALHEQEQRYKLRV